MTKPTSTVSFALRNDAEDKERILRALKQANGNRSVAAELLGIGRTTLYSKLEEMQNALSDLRMQKLSSEKDVENSDGVIRSCALRLAENTKKVLSLSEEKKTIEAQLSGIAFDIEKIHVFDKENRLFYDLERIWRDGNVISMEELNN